MKDGGPAFPGGAYMTREYDMQLDGMTLRQYYAAAALTGILANRDSWELTQASASQLAFSYADAMLKEG